MNAFRRCFAGEMGKIDERKEKESQNLVAGFESVEPQKAFGVRRDEFLVCSEITRAVAVNAGEPIRRSRGCHVVQALDHVARCGEQRIDLLENDVEVS